MVRLIDVFDLRQQRNVLALLALGMGGVGTWLVRSVLSWLVRYGVEAPVGGEPGPFSLAPPFALTSLLWSVLYWAFYAAALTALASRLGSERAWVAAFALLEAGYIAFTNALRARLVGAPMGLDLVGLAVGAVGSALGLAVVLGLFRWTRRAGLAFVLGLPSGALLMVAWDSLAWRLRTWGEGVRFGDTTEFYAYLWLQGAAGAMVPGLLFAAGLSLDARRRGTTAGDGTRQPIPRWSAVAPLVALLGAGLGICTLGFGLMAGPLEGQGRIVLVWILALPLLLANVAVCAFLVHRMWRAVPADFARTSPGRAAGLLFVPLFNLYWLFPVFTGFAGDWNRAHAADSSRHVPRLPFVALPVTAVLGWLAAMALEGLIDDWPGQKGFWLAISLGLGFVTAVLTTIVASLATDAVNGVRPEAAQRAARPTGHFPRYSGSGLCDVCNREIAAGEAFSVPVGVVYSSRAYRTYLAHHPMVRMAGGDVDAYLAGMRAMDTTTHSAVCPDCIHMFP